MDYAYFVIFREQNPSLITEGQASQMRLEKLSYVRPSQTQHHAGGGEVEKIYKYWESRLKGN